MKAPLFPPRLAVRLALLAALLTALVSPRAAFARGPTGDARDASAADPVRAAEKAYGELEYEGANQSALRALKAGGLSRTERVRALTVLAVTEAILDQGNIAKEAFVALLASEPDFDVDSNLGPKVTAPFNEARAISRAWAVRPGLEVSFAGAPPPGTLRVVTHDPTHRVEKRVVGFRWGTSGDFTTKTFVSPPGPDADAVVVPPAPRGALRLDYYVLALDAQTNVVFDAGTESTPKTLLPNAMPNTLAKTMSGDDASEAPSGEHRSIFASPWFWAATAVVLGGAGTAVYFATRPRDATTVQIVPVVQCGAMSCR